MIIQMTNYPVTGINNKVSNEVYFSLPLTQAIDEFISLSLTARDELSVLLTQVGNREEQERLTDIHQAVQRTIICISEVEKMLRILNETDSKLYYFDPETANFNKISKNIDGWCKLLLSDYNVITGFNLAHSWQKSNGAIPSGYRLMPKIPFVVGGSYEINNLYMCRSSESLKTRANIALQIRDMPDGSNIQIVIND